MDDELHEQLLRRPKHKASLNGAWQVDRRGRCRRRCSMSGSRVDGNRDFSIPRLKADGYTMVNFAGTYDLNDA